MSYTAEDIQAFMNEVEANNSQIAALQERNKQIRVALSATALGDAWGDAQGTHNLDVCGVPLKFVFKQNYTVNAGALSKIYDNLSEDAKKAFKYKPELSLTGYKNTAISDEERRLINSVVTSKPGLPTIEKR